jgi:hypothetical protein
MNMVLPDGSRASVARLERYTAADFGRGASERREYSTLSDAEIDAEVDQKIRASMAGHKTDYQTAYRAVLGDPSNASLTREYAAFRIRRRA